jgi:hypothetical protein
MGKLPYVIASITIFCKRITRTFMHHRLYSISGLKLIITALVILLIFLPGAVCAEQPVQNNSSVLQVNTSTTS